MTMMKSTSIRAHRTIKSIFYEVQLNKSNHEALKHALKDIYNQMSILDFVPEFIKCLKICLMHDEKSENLERTLNFAADFAVSFSNDLDEEESCPLLEGVFEFIFNSHENRVPSIRLRVCQLMNRLLDNMGKEGSVAVETCDKITENMLVRLKDRMSSVRTQAVYALQRLQTPSEPNCEIIKAFTYHMTHDPCHDVRRAVVQTIAISKLTIQAILSRINDIKDTVRRETYVVIHRLSIRQLTIRQRQHILESGLRDRSGIVREYFIGTLVPKWVKFFNNNYYDFLETLHVEKIPDSGLKVLKEIFKMQNDVLLESRLKEMWIIDKKIPYDKLNMITVIYWRALADFSKPTEESDQYEQIFENVLPDLTPFCQYIREYVFPIKAEKEQNELESSEQTSNNKTTGMDVDGLTKDQHPSENQEDSKNANITEKVDGSPQPHIPNENVLIHLLEMCNLFDLSDEMGRSKLRELASDLVLSTKPSLGLTTIATIARLIDHIVPDSADKLSLAAELVTELREPLVDAAPEVNDNYEKIEKLTQNIQEHVTEMEIAKELNDGERIEEISNKIKELSKELEELNTETPNELGREVNNDPATLKKCLTIVVEILKNGSITKMNPTLYSLMQNFIVPTLNLKVDGSEDDACIRGLALQCLGVFCNLDQELAKEHFNMFCFSIAIPSIALVALRNVFDLLQVYGLATFNIEDPCSEDGNSSNREVPKKPNLITLLTKLLKSESQEIRKTAMVGLCKLILARRITSVDLVPKLIMLWHDKSYDADPHVRQPLGMYFRLFSHQFRHGPSMLVRAAIPTLRQVFRLEVEDNLVSIQPDHVANLLVDLTRPWLNKFTPKGYNTHNQLAILICEELLTGELEAQQKLVLLRMLTHLEIDFKLAKDVDILMLLSTRVVKEVGNDKMLLRLALKFETALQNQQDGNKTVSTVNNTLPGDGFKRKNTLIATRDNSDESGSEDAEDEEELSQELTNSRLYQSSIGGIEIPGTPETSDEEIDEIFQGALAPKKSRTSDDPGFKRPAVPPASTPAKVDFKVPKRTPKKAASTPAKHKESSKSRISDSSIDISIIEPPRTPTREEPPAKQSKKTPAKSGALTRSGRKQKL